MGTNTIITDPGYVVVDPNQPHTVDLASHAYYPNDPAKDINFKDLVVALMHTGAIQISTNIINDQNPGNIQGWQEVPASMNEQNISAYYFRFKDMYYRTSDGNVKSQIKYTTEGTPDTIEYLWPEMSFDFTYSPGETLYTVYDTNYPSKFVFDITPIALIGEFIDGHGYL
jgi:hypothetical protein